MTGDLSVKRLWTEGPETWVLILGRGFACSMNLGQPFVHQAVLDPESVSLVSLRSSCKQRPARDLLGGTLVRDHGKEPERGKACSGVQG